MMSWIQLMCVPVRFFRALAMSHREMSHRGSGFCRSMGSYLALEDLVIHRVLLAAAPEERAQPHEHHEDASAAVEQPEAVVARLLKRLVLVGVLQEADHGEDLVVGEWSVS